MSISSGRLLAHCCCTCMLLLYLASATASPVQTATATPTATTTTTTTTTSATATSGSSRVHRAETDDRRPDFLAKKGKCQYNLTERARPLQAESISYQRQGYVQCEYLLWAPTGHIILLNLTSVHSRLPVMPVGTREHTHHLQAASATTPAPKADTTSTTTALHPPLHDNSRARENTDREPTSIHSEHSNPQESESVQGWKGLQNSNHTEPLPNSGTISSSSRSENKTRGHNPQQLTIISKHSVENGLVSDQVLDHLEEPDRDKASESASSSEESSDSGEQDIRTPVPSAGHDCSLKLVIESAADQPGFVPQVICWVDKWQQKIPLVYQYTVPIKITYLWDALSPSSFSLDFNFLRAQDLDCTFKCNSHLCLLDYQLCDGFADCPDQSDEQSSACNLAQQSQDNDELHMINVVAIVVAVVVLIIIVAVIILMIRRSRCRSGAHRGRDSLLQPQNSQSSEVCRSTSGSVEDSGQYEALLQDCHHHHQHHHQQRHHQQQRYPTTAMTRGEHHRVLLQQQQQPQHLQHQQLQEQHPPQQASHTHVVGEGSATDSSASRHWPQHHHHLHQHQHHPQKQYQQQEQQHQRHHRQSPQRGSPDELFPPHIPVSGDGEEGYITAQRALHSKQQLERNWQVEHEVFRPPPNRTIFDRDSPPPPYSLNPPGAKSLDSLVPPVVLRPDRGALSPQESPPSGVPRCHSLSCHR